MQLDSEYGSSDELKAILTEASSTLHAPWSKKRKTKIILDATNEGNILIAKTLVSILASTIQSFSIEIIGLDSSAEKIFLSWTSDDKRITYTQKSSWQTIDSYCTVVVYPGMIFTRYALEAILVVFHNDKNPLMRILMQGHSKSVEVWNSVDGGWDLTVQQNEESLRQQGKERWAAGVEFGLYAHGQEKPKPFFGKGPAGQHVLQIITYDSRDDALHSAIFAEQDRLLTQIRKLKTEIGYLTKNPRGISRVQIGRLLRTLRSKLKEI